MYYAGVDIGSAASKAAIIDKTGKLLAFCVRNTESDRNASGISVLEEAAGFAGICLADIKAFAGTGYGRKALEDADYNFPEIICHAVGTSKLMPGVGSIIDIGGQDSKVIELDVAGKVRCFEMNDKCAAGTGRFFEVLADKILHVGLGELEELMNSSEDECKISSMCTIFAETEIISCLSAGVSREAVAAGMGRAVVKRVLNMAAKGQVKLTEPVVFSGGAARNHALGRMFGEELGVEVIIPEQPQVTAAYGAALMCLSRENARQV